MEAPVLLWPYGDAAALLFAALGLGLLVGAAAVLRSRGVSAGLTRALVHIGTGVAVAFAPRVFASPLGPGALALVWAGVNLWAIRAGRLHSLHAFDRASLGTVAFPLALVAGVGVLHGLSGLPGRPDLGWSTALGASVWQAAWLVLAFADPAAGFVGRWYGRGAPKSEAGSLAFSGVAFFTAALSLAASPGWEAGSAVHAAFVLTFVTTACERIGRRGWDNLAVVVGGLAALAAAVRPFSPSLAPGGFTTDEHAYAVVAAGLAFAWAAARARVLTLDGALAGGLLAATVVAFGGAYHLWTGLAFFVLASALSHLPGGQEAAARAEKGHTRDAGQVLANGGVAWACLLLFPDVPALWGGAFAAAAADTWATEIGTRWGGSPRLITTMRRVPAGTSGAVSGMGTLGALLGAASVVGIGLLTGEARAAVADPVRVGLAMGAGGLSGAFFDTLLGATLQVRYRTPGGALTEHRAAPDGTPHPHAGGWRWMNNDVVNALATLAGAVVAGLIAVGL